MSGSRLHSVQNETFYEPERLEILNEEEGGDTSKIE